MANINIDEILRHSTYLARLETQGYNSFIAPSLAQTLRDIRRLLADYDDITSQRQLKAIETAITQIIMQQPGWAALTTELDSLAVYENEFYAKLIATGTTAAAAERVKKLADNTMLILRSGEKFNTGFWPEFVRNNLVSQAQRVNNIVRTAYAGQISVAESRKQISTLFDGLLSREAEALARTGYTHFAAVGRRAFIDANKDLIAREVPICVFDNRTTDICLSISARYGVKGWPAGDSPVGYAPYHVNCRTTIVPLAEGQELTGTRAAVGGQKGEEAEKQFNNRNDRLKNLREQRQEMRDENGKVIETKSQVRYRGRKDSDIFKAGQIKASTGIETWLREQPEWFIRDTLGAKRAELFMKGELNLRNLTDASLKPLTLDQIRAREGG